MAKMVASGVLLLVMAMVLVNSAGAAACPPPLPLNCASYILDGRVVPLKFCCIEVQDNFKLLQPTSSLKPWCAAIKAVKLYTGQGLSGSELDLALGLPQKCGLSMYKQGQTCDGKLMPGGTP